MAETRNADDYEKAITAAKLGAMSPHQESLMKSLMTEHGERGNRAREAMR